MPLGVGQGLPERPVGVKTPSEEGPAVPQAVSLQPAATTDGPGRWAVRGALRPGVRAGSSAPTAHPGDPPTTGGQGQPWATASAPSLWGGGSRDTPP